jgi:hypothetical protein
MRRLLFRGLIATSLCLILVSGCAKPVPSTSTVGSPEAVWFEDATAEVGLNFVHDAGPTGAYFMPQSIGSGAALIDFNNDGRLDLYLLHNGGPRGKTNQLFQQMPDGRFKDVSTGSGLDVAGYNMGVAVGDVNNDGWPDLLLTQYGAIKLFLNNGNGTFSDVTAQAGLSNLLWAVSASFVDYDRDGWLDLVVVNYVDYDPSVDCVDPSGVKEFCSPRTFEGTAAKLFHNRGPAAAAKGPACRVGFEDVSLSSGLGRVAGTGLGVICADFNRDGWPDIFIANDWAANHLWINRRDGTFQEEAVQRGLAYNVMGQAEANMGIALGDVDGDGLFDVFITHLNIENHTLWKQGPAGIFRDQTAAFGLGWPKWRGTGWGTVLADFDHDGFLDLALVNGEVGRNRTQVNPELGPFWKDYASRNLLFRNDRGTGFLDLGPQSGPFGTVPRVSRGLLVGDIRNTGALDLVTTEIAGPARLFRNVVPHRGHWLGIRARDPRLKRDAYGAEVTVRAGDRRWWRLVNPSGSFASSSDPRVHFGLGNVERIDSIEVLWPDGLRELFPAPSLDQHLVLERGGGCPQVKGKDR